MGIGFVILLAAWGGFCVGVGIEWSHNENKKRRKGKRWSKQKQIGDAIENALLHYKCQYTCVEGDEMSGLGLVDILSPRETIKEGKEEIVLIADAVYDAIVPLLREWFDADRLRKHVEGGPDD